MIREIAESGRSCFLTIGKTHFELIDWGECLLVARKVHIYSSLIKMNFLHRQNNQTFFFTNDQTLLLFLFIFSLFIKSLQKLSRHLAKEVRKKPLWPGRNLKHPASGWTAVCLGRLSWVEQFWAFMDLPSLWLGLFSLTSYESISFPNWLCFQTSFYFVIMAFGSRGRHESSATPGGKTHKTHTCPVWCLAEYRTGFK